MWLYTTTYYWSRIAIRLSKLKILRGKVDTRLDVAVRGNVENSVLGEEYCSYSESESCVRTEVCNFVHVADNSDNAVHI